MKYKDRRLSARLGALVEHFPVVVLSGARQVGKSTLLLHQYGGWDRVVFDPVADVGNARAEPELFLQNNPPPVILDEIQYCPEIVPPLKRLIDEKKRPGMYILTGSQQWSVLSTISESLAGRAVLVDMEGFALAESGMETGTGSWLESYLSSPEGFVASRHERLELDRPPHELLWRGGLPEVDALPLELVADYHASYLRTYIERDARLMLSIADWQQFGQFVQLASALTAQEVNYSHLGRDIGVTPQTAKRWLAVLKATFQWFEVPAYCGNAVKRLSAKPKGYFADTGFACHLNMISSHKALGGHPLLGPLFETAVVAEIRKHLTWMGPKARLFHWRLHSGSEVDLVLEHDGRFYPLEIKHTRRPRPKDARGIRAFRESYPQADIAPGLVIAPTEGVLQLTAEDYAIPWDLRNRL